MNTRMVLLLSFLLCVAAAGAASATPSLVGPTGLAVHPTADVPPVGAVDLAVDFQDTKDFFGDMWLNRLVFGADKNLEVALGYTGVKGETEFDTGRMYQIGVKYLLLDDPEDGLKVSAGTGYLKFNNSWDVHGAGGYVVASKYLRRASADQPDGQVDVRGHLGIIYGSFKEHEAGEEFSGTLFKPWLGCEFILPPGTTLALEYRPRTKKFESNDIFGAVLRHSVSKRLGAEVGTTNVFSNGEKQAVFYGLSYRLADRGQE